VLSITGLNHYYGQSHTLRDFKLEVPEGKCTVLMGRNGVGKTTLLQCIMGQLGTASGSILFDATDLLAVGAERRAGLGIGYVPQGRQIFPMLSVEENLLTGLAARSDQTRTIPELIFDLFPVLHDMRKRRGGDLSGGQQQQLAIGRALVTDPSLLILDEPTEGIQPNIVRDIGQIVRQLNHEKGLTILIVEQKLPFARAVGDRFCVVDRGRSVATGSMSELCDDLVRQYLTV